MRSRLLAVASVGLASVTAVIGQSNDRCQTPTFRIGTTLVEVSAIVTARGEPVTDLRLDEVEVLDNGVPQPLVAFEYVDLSTVPGPEQRRDFVLVLDDFHIAAPLSKPTIDLATALIDALGPHDRLAIVNTGPHELVQQFSTDRNAARALVRRFRGQKGGGGVLPGELEFKTLVALRVVKGVAEAMTGDPTERRTVLVVSEGHAVGPTDPRQLGDYRDVLDAYEDIVATAALANVAIYGIDPRGLVASFPSIGTGGHSDAAAVAGTTAVTAANRMMVTRYGSLGRMADSTGGALTIDSNDLAKGLPGMIRDSRQYYRIAYLQPDVPPDERRKARRIQVRVTRPEVQVRARQTYLAR